jgi:hypothetical protein
MAAEDVLNTQMIEKARTNGAFKQKLLSDPREAIREAFNVDIPAHIQLTAVEETSCRLFLVIPPNPTNIDEDSTSTDGTW